MVGNKAERAKAFEDCRLMIWSRPEIEQLILGRPKLGVALMQLLCKRIRVSSDRLVSLSADSIKWRLGRFLILMADKIGVPSPGGCVQIPALTHDLIASYVLTSREIVTQYMNALRRDGLVEYSRKGVSVKVGPLNEWLAKK